MKYLIMVSIVVIILIGLKIWFDRRLKSLTGHFEEVGKLSDEIMEQYLASGLDKYYNELESEKLINEYRSLFVQQDKSIEIEAEIGAKSKLIEDEMTRRSIDFESIIDELTNPQS